MNERVRVYVGDRKKPSLAFDLLPGVALSQGLIEEACKSLARSRKLMAKPPMTKKARVNMRSLVKRMKLLMLNGGPLKQVVRDAIVLVAEECAGMADLKSNDCFEEGDKYLEKRDSHNYVASTSKAWVLWGLGAKIRRTFKPTEPSS